ncbi:glycoside hydrolase family 3 N-terminal domain-containing protein [Ruegeria sp. SCPT10]|uniref:glycoside hydrolase family 3 N-terminal domain-containing protein n=1 Tax=Ruegeria sp. SCP10 TaxID=3141377 RepID=UPI00333D7E44
MSSPKKPDAMLYLDPKKPVADRVSDLLARMELPEKLAQMHALWLELSEDGVHRMRPDASNNFEGGDPAKVRQLFAHGLGQITRPLGTIGVAPHQGVRALNRLQKDIVEGTRLGIPVMSHEECLSGLMVQGATLFPSPLSLAASWNPDLVERIGAAIGAEGRSVGCHQGLAPVLDVSRDVRWGRTEECFAEDPYLTGLLATRYVRGLQGDDRGLLATLKHYVGHSASEGGRNHAPVHLGPRELADDFMLPFEMAVKQAQAASVMPAYHDIDGEPLHASRHLLTKVLREQWGFDGLIVADYIGISLLETHHAIAHDKGEAAAIAFRSGLDLELPSNECTPHLEHALKQGQITLHDIDAVVQRLLSEKFRLGLFEQPYADEGAIALRTQGAIELAREAGAQGVTLLENNGTLPLSPATKIAVIGPTANDPLALLGDYAFPVHLINNDADTDTAHVVTPLQGLKAQFGAENVTFAQGCYILETRGSGNPVFPGDMADTASLALNSPVSTRTDLIAHAVQTAKAADVTVLCVGDLSGIFQTGTVGEGSDVDTLDLPGVQQQLLDALLDAGQAVIVVMSSGRPYTLGNREKDLAALLVTHFSGEQGGHALADVISGAMEPSGRLTLSTPRSAGACPYHYNHKFKSAGTPIARHFGSDYPFGHGLSYTNFNYRDLELKAERIPNAEGELHLSFTIRNNGERKGVEVPQLYVRDQVASLVRPIKELKCFARVTLDPGQQARVEFVVPTDMLNFSGSSGARIVEPGTFELMIGASSSDIRLKDTIEVTGEVHVLSQNWRMESHAKVIVQA